MYTHVSKVLSVKCFNSSSPRMNLFLKPMSLVAYYRTVFLKLDKITNKHLIHLVERIKFAFKFVNL